MLGGMFTLMWFDTSTELTPNHHGTTGLLLVASVPFALAGIPIAWRSTRRLLACVALPLCGVVAVMFAGLSVSKLVWNAIDFPVGRTHDVAGVLLPISHASRSRDNRGAHDQIELMSSRSDLAVNDADYHFMLAHRRPDDQGVDSDEIASNGWFCAKVRLQRAGDAVRVLHAGSWALPEGSIQLCLTDPAGQAHILK